MATSDPPPDDLELFREPLEPPTRDVPAARTLAGRERSRLIAVSGAKGGVGKSVFAANLALYLATIGRRVVLVDADREGSNLHTLLGLEPPGQGIAEGGPSPVELLPTGVQGLDLCIGGIDAPPPGAERRRTRAALFSRLEDLAADHVVVDLGSGTQRSLIDLWLKADVTVFLTLPEPTSVENTYRFLRAAFEQHLYRITSDDETRRQLRDRLRTMGPRPFPSDVVRRLDSAGDPLADVVRVAMDEFSFPLVVNEARVRADLELGAAMRSAVWRRLGLEIPYLGYVEFDDAVWTSVRARRPILVESPGSKAGRHVEKVARRLLGLELERRTPKRRAVPYGSHHDLLEVDRGATDEDVRRAYKRMKEIYAADSKSSYGLFDAAALKTLQVRLLEAHDVLLDPARRRPYELSVFPEELPAPPPRAAPSPSAAPRPPAPLVTPDTEYTGELLRAWREAQGYSLAALSDETKVSEAYLAAIEREDFAALPAPVYVRGFVHIVARALRIDGLQASRSFVRRYERFLGASARRP